MLDLSNRLTGLSANVVYFEKFVFPSPDIRYEMDYGRIAFAIWGGMGRVSGMRVESGFL